MRITFWDPIYIYIYVDIHIHMYVCMYICMYMYIYSSADVYMCMQKYVSICGRIYVHTCISMGAALVVAPAPLSYTPSREGEPTQPIKANWGLLGTTGSAALLSRLGSPSLGSSGSNGLYDSRLLGLKYVPMFGIWSIMDI